MFYPLGIEDPVGSFATILVIVLLIQSAILELCFRNAPWRRKAKFYKANWIAACILSAGIAIIIPLSYLINPEARERALAESNINAAIDSSIAELKRLKTNVIPSLETNRLQITNLLTRISQIDTQLTNAIRVNTEVIGSQTGKYLGKELTNRVSEYLLLRSFDPLLLTNLETSALQQSVERRISILSQIERERDIRAVRYTVFVVFIIGLIRALMEFVLDRVTRRWRILSDSLLFGLLLALLLDRFPELPSATLTSRLLSASGTFAMILCALVYLAWVYQLIFHQLTETEEFAAPVASKFLTSPLKLEVPVQAVLIGPKEAGKSRIFSSVTGDEYVAGSSTSYPTSGSCPWAPEGKLNLRIGLIDTPGEHLGSHLAAAQNFRTDLLIIVLNAKSLKAEFLVGQRFGTLEGFGLSAFHENATVSRDYWLALDYATRQSLGGKRPTLRSVYKVKTLSLFVYVPPGNLPLSEENLESLRAAAKMLSERFAVEYPDKVSVCQFVAGPDWRVNGIDVIKTVSGATEH